MKKLLSFITTLIGITLISACTPKISRTDLPDILTRSDLCIPSLVTAPFNLAPSNGFLSNPEGVGFSWEFDPRPGCGADGFMLHFSETPRGTTIASWWLPVEVTGVTVDPSFMENCSKYYWDVAALGGGMMNISEPALIWTDFSSTCPAWENCDTPGSIDFAYVNFWPYDGQIIWTPNPSLLWDVIDPEDTHCAVDNYHWEVSTSPTFSSIVASGDTTNRSYIPPSGSHYLEDCTLYFWRITAQSLYNTEVSNTLHFATDIDALISTDPFRRCGSIRTMCTPTSMPESVSLVSPAEGTTIARLNPQLVWTYDYFCRPNNFTVVVSESPSLDSPVLNISDYWGDMWTDFSSASDYLEDCKTYYWQVTAATDLALLPGEPPYAEVLSPLGIFHTDVDGSCTETGGSTKAVLKGLSVGCLSLNTQFAFLDFDQPIIGDFETHIKDETWPCNIEADNPKRLFCSGPGVEGGIFANLELWDRDLNQKILSQQVTTPNCQEEIKPTACPTPAKPCSPNCNFNSQTCQCEANGKPCP